MARYSTFSRLKRVTAWIIRFVDNCRARKKDTALITSPLTVGELDKAESYWVKLSQRAHFSREIGALKAERGISRASPLLSLNLFLDTVGLLRVGGREQNSKRLYGSQHPLIMHARHPIAKFLARSEHVRLLHVGYAGPVYIKLGAVRRPTIIKAYVAVFVSLSVKAVHIEAVSDLTTEAFLACLWRFVARCGKPVSIWSDHATNFVGASCVLTDLYRFLCQPGTEEAVTDFCTSQGIAWDFIPERAPHFGGLWEAAVKSLKKHLARIVGNVKLNFDELSTVLCQIEACLNRCPYLMTRMASKP